MQKVTLSLWFESCAEEAAEFYVACFGDGRILDVMRQGAVHAEGGVMAVRFELFGQSYLAINGGTECAFTPALSLLVSCDSQQEIDHYWARLAEGGRPMRCGWIADRFGVTWQIIPKNFAELAGRNGGRALAAASHMQKIDLAALERAAQESA